jgi:twinfilin-like protein
VRTTPDAGSAAAAGPDRLAAITFVPDAAPVRQKMLTAATRLSLLRELGGAERVGESRVCTRVDEFATARGWDAHAAHEAGAAPLTEEERGARELREMEAADVGGMARRGAGYGPRQQGGKSLPAEDGVVEALRGVGEGVLVLLALGEGEKFVLVRREEGVEPGQLAERIDADVPRYSLYGYAYGGEVKVLFVYTCPTATKVRDRMLYASCRRSAEVLAETEAGLVLAKKVRGQNFVLPGLADVRRLRSRIRASLRRRVFWRSLRLGRRRRSVLRSPSGLGGVERKCH